MTIVPSNGIVGQGIARGIVAGFVDAGKLNQWDALSKLIQDLRAQNPGLEEMPGYRKALNFGGANGESVFLEGNSPVQGEKEYVWLVAALKPKGLFRMLMISPASDYSSERDLRGCGAVGRTGVAHPDPIVYIIYLIRQCVGSARNGSEAELGADQGHQERRVLDWTDAHAGGARAEAIPTTNLRARARLPPSASRPRSQALQRQVVRLRVRLVVPDVLPADHELKALAQTGT
ncbi:MAG: hypothetical protein R2748_28345 [Bryobacterales bacterium]